MRVGPCSKTVAECSGKVTHLETVPLLRKHLHTRLYAHRSTHSHPHSAGDGGYFGPVSDRNVRQESKEIRLLCLGLGKEAEHREEELKDK